MTYEEMKADLASKIYDLMVRLVEVEMKMGCDNSPELGRLADVFFCLAPERETDAVIRAICEECKNED